MAKLAVIYNPKSGGGNDLKNEIKEAFKSSASELKFFDIASDTNSLVADLKKWGAAAVIAAGGDGTVNCVANLATKLDMPMGVLPIGTLNHFSKDLKIPLDLADAAKVITDANTQRIDFGTVNEHVFVNNSSIGLYPSTVKKRDALAPKTGKWLGATIASIGVLLRLSTTHFGFEFEDKSLVFKTPLVFVGNGSYRHEEIGFTNRNSLTGGKLFLYIVRANRVLGIIRLTILAFVGKRPKNKDYLALISKPLVINSRKRLVDVAVDGEVLSLHPPLKYELHPKALAVFVAKN